MKYKRRKTRENNQNALLKRIPRLETLLKRRF
nr:MAG TPA: hypothetical protein [Caudoviricetes sp.]